MAGTSIVIGLLRAAAPCYNGRIPMDENPPSHPGLPEESYIYKTLGAKTLALFVLQRIGAPFVLLVVGSALLLIQRQDFITQIPIPDFPYYLTLGGLACILLFAIFFVLAFFISWLVYVNYKFALGENSLKIKRGILNKEEVAIPYRQIQDVDVRRDLGFRMMGLSRIIILTAGHEDPMEHDDYSEERGESEGYFPALDHNLAEWLQAEILKRANVQKVVETKE